MVEKLKGGKSLRRMRSRAEGLKVETAKGVKRRGTEPLPPAGGRWRCSAPQRTPPGSADGKDADERFVFRVTDITMPAYDSEIARSQARSAHAEDCALRRTAGRNIVAQLESDLGTTINRAALSQADPRRQRELSRRMQIEPAADAFAQTYARGAAQVVWTTLVADLETPVSAFLEDRQRQADEFSAGVGRGRRRARALFDHRLDPDLVWRTNGARAEINAIARRAGELR